MQAKHNIMLLSPVHAAGYAGKAWHEHGQNNDRDSSCVPYIPGHAINNGQLTGWQPDMKLLAHLLSADYDTCSSRPLAHIPHIPASVLLACRPTGARQIKQRARQQSLKHISS